MKHVVAFVIKLLLIAVILEIVLISFTALTIGDIAMISLVVSLVSYLIVDLLVLSFSNNTVATLTDTLITFATIYLFNYRYGMGTVNYVDCAIAAIILGIAECFFHTYMARAVFPKRRKT
jgi:hypothetical protein